MSPRVPQDGAARETVRSTRLGPADDAAFTRRRKERGESVSAYLRSLVRADADANPEKKRDA